MGVLEDIMGMKKQGYSDSDIVNELSRQGVSPREINDALKQAQIKSAVSDYGYEGMEQSVMQENDAVPSPNQMYQPQAQEYAPQEQQQYVQPEYAPQEAQQYYPQQGGYEQQYSAPSPSQIDTDTIMEISDQVFSDKIKKFQKVLDATSEAAITLQTKFENISERLKKIETTIDKLQIAILEKVGSYGQNLEGIKKEMSMMQDSFSKMVSPSRERESPRRQMETPEYSEEGTSENQRKVRKI